jgi:uncharacterized membrane protein
VSFVGAPAELLPKRVTGLRTNSFAAIVMLLIEFALGVGVNLYATLPGSDTGRSVLPAFGHAVTGGPVVLALHAILGTLLLVTGTTAVVRAALIRRTMLIAVTTVALLSIIVAWLSGARFVGSMADGASMAMATATAVSLLSYALILFVVPAVMPTDRKD